eukprot:gene20696-12483_t
MRQEITAAVTDAVRMAVAGAVRLQAGLVDPTAPAAAAAAADGGAAPPASGIATPVAASPNGSRASSMARGQVRRRDDDTKTGSRSGSGNRALWQCAEVAQALAEKGGLTAG